jgi:autotransporter family porin
VVANVVAAQAANAEVGFLQLATLHQRVGEHRTLLPELQGWVKAYHSRLNVDGKHQFGFEQRTSGFQVGQEFLAHATESGGSERAAIAVDYAYSDTDFEDRLRGRSVNPQSNGLYSRDTGSMDAQSLALGGYYTRSAENGAYVDLVGQVASLRNKFRDSEGVSATQKGWRAGLSVEGGYPLWTAGTEKDWLLEGQAQLSYQYTKYRSFDGGDQAFQVEKYDADTLRGRLGLRLVRSLKTAQDKTLQLYGLFNVVHDFLDPEAVRFGDGNGAYTQVNEHYGRSYGEVGFGVQGYVSKSTSVFGDLRYQQGVWGGSADREGGSLNVGVRYSF